MDIYATPPHSGRDTLFRMITDADITKLKGVFATKDDLKGFATKDDLGRFATKDALAELRADMQVGFGEVNEKIDTLATAFSRMENTLDGIVGAIQDLRTENGAGTTHLLRHDRQIEALALATKVTLPN